jgi:hypothetical protein
VGASFVSREKDQDHRLGAPWGHDRPRWRCHGPRRTWLAARLSWLAAPRCDWLCARGRKHPQWNPGFSRRPLVRPSRGREGSWQIIEGPYLAGRLQPSHCRNGSGISSGSARRSREPSHGSEASWGDVAQVVFERSLSWSSKLVLTARNGSTCDGQPTDQGPPTGDGEWRVATGIETVTARVRTVALRHLLNVFVLLRRRSPWHLQPPSGHRDGPAPGERGAGGELQRTVLIGGRGADSVACTI